jgi:hypothetical protein
MKMIKNKIENNPLSILTKRMILLAEDLVQLAEELLLMEKIEDVNFAKKKKNLIN